MELNGSDCVALVAEALRQGKVICLSNFNYGPIVTLPPIKDMNLSIPIFELEWPGYYNIPEADFDQLRIQQHENVELNDFHLPYDQCVFVVTEGSPKKTDKAVYVVYNFDTYIAIYLFTIVDYQGKKNQVLVAPVIITINLDVTGDEPIYKVNPISEENYNSEDEGNAKGANTILDGVIWSVHLVNLPSTNRVYGEITSPSTKVINEGRIKAKLPPIQKPIKLSVSDPKELIVTRNPNAHGSSRRPHDRRGHDRRLQSGKIVWIRDTKIKGGGFNPPRYTIH